MALSTFDINIKAEYYAINILARDALSAQYNTAVIVCVYLYVRPTVRLSVPWTPAGMGKGRLLHVLTNNWTRGKQPANPQISHNRPSLRKHSPDGATTEPRADIQLQLTTHLSTPRG